MENGLVSDFVMMILSPWGFIFGMGGFDWNGWI